MDKTSLLNTASDLRRIASWVGRGQKEKTPIILNYWKSIKNQKQVWQTIKHFQADLNPQKVLKDKEKQPFFAEQLLIVSLRLTHLAQL